MIHTIPLPLRFLHTSDIHFLDLEGVSARRYVGKRLTGWLNLMLRRGRKHDQMLYDRMAQIVADLGIDRVVVTGDLTNLSLESEFELTRKKLDALPVPCTVIPGNHDPYTSGSARAHRFEEYLGHLMDGERLDGERYPFMQRYDGVASSAYRRRSRRPRSMRRAWSGPSNWSVWAAFWPRQRTTNWPEWSSSIILRLRE